MGRAPRGPFPPYIPRGGAPILSFDLRGPNEPWAFLSNFYPLRTPLRLRDCDLEFWTVEAAFQAAKTIDLEERRWIAEAPSPGAAKRLGRAATLREGWDDMRVAVMRACLEKKFADDWLRRRLMATGDRHLEEGNTWGDRFWGTVDGVGENWLGRLLMERRELLIVEATTRSELA